MSAKKEFTTETRRTPGEQPPRTPCLRGEISPLAQWLGADQCERKRRYADKRDAQTALNSFSKFRGRHGRPEQLRAYHCPACQGWHLTKKV